MPSDISSCPRVSFGIIILNGEPFTRYCLRSIYAFAHEIIVAEGASPGARRVADDRGHSSDGTLQVLREFQANEDPEGKLTIVTAEDEGHPDGFWPGEKDEQSRAYAKRASGDYLWQVDVDEFYKPEDMRGILKVLEADRSITGMSFKQLTFWGGFDYLTDGPFVRYAPSVRFYRRLFRWGPGYEYASHRPPTVLDHSGRDLCAQRWMHGNQLARHGILMYHYSLVFPKQVDEKCRYYADADWAKRHGAESWARECYQALSRPYRVHNVFRYPSWLERFEGDHPAQIEALRRDILTGNCGAELRASEDIEQLLNSRGYRVGRSMLRALTPLYGLRFAVARSTATALASMWGLPRTTDGHGLRPPMTSRTPPTT